MRELMAYAGHLDCYGKDSEILKRFLSVEASNSYVYRVTDMPSESL